MKKIWIISAMMLFTATTAMAAPGGHFGAHHDVRPVHETHFPRPQPVHHRGHGSDWSGFWGGLVGSVIGNYVVSSQYQPATYSSTRCFTMVSALNGTTVRKCINTQGYQNWNQGDVYNVLYVD